MTLKNLLQALKSTKSIIIKLYDIYNTCHVTYYIDIAYNIDSIKYQS